MLKLTTPLALAAAGTLAFAAPGSAVVGQAAKTKKIAVKDNRFSPKTLTIRKGTKLDWVWKGENPHNVRFGKHRSKTKIHGSYAVKFSHKGTYKIYCSIHRDLGMKMKVVVESSTRPPRAGWSETSYWITRNAPRMKGCTRQKYE